MAEQTILVNLNRCTGCWTCSMACKLGNRLADDEWWNTVRTLGSGEGIDRPGGQWPDLRMSWIPVYHRDCILCAGRTAQGELPYCVAACPCEALHWGDLEDEKSEVSKQVADLRARDFRIFRLPNWENTRKEMVYASKA